MQRSSLKQLSLDYVIVLLRSLNTHAEVVKFWAFFVEIMTDHAEKLFYSQVVFM